MIVKIKDPGASLKEGTILTLPNVDGHLMFGDQEIKTKAALTRPQYNAVVRKSENSEATVSVELYAHLHGHTDNSLLDGMSKVGDYAKRTTTVSAMTDHGNLYGMTSFFKAMKKEKKRAIIAFEGYVEDPITSKLDGMHTCFFAKDEQGYKNLLKLCSEAFENMYRGHPHVTDALLRKYHEGIIVSSACLGGPIQQYLMKGQSEEAETILKYYLKIFGKENFYLEVQRHGVKEEPMVERGLIELSKKYDLPIICTTDSHYSRKEDKEAHEVLLCLQTGKRMDEPHMQFEGTGYWIHTSEEVEELFYDHPEWLDNTLALADRCQAVVPLGDLNLPEFKIPAPYKSQDEYFEYLCKTGYENRFAGTPEHDDPVYLERYDYEFSMIKQMGFVSYFLIVQDYIAWARDHDIYVGPGRGSAAGSLIAYCIGITDLDPIKFNLLFERFLNPERVSMPDVDTDFEHSRRGEVIDYVRQKYGQENVCHIVTFGTMAAKMAIKDVARVLGYPVSVGLELAKMIPEEPKMTIQLAFEKNPEFKARYESDNDTKRIVDIAMAVEGSKRHASQHACGIVISPKKVDEFIPTSLVADEETGIKDVTTQAVMTEVEELSLLKMDFLGLKNMSVIHEVIDTIKRTRGIDITYHDIPLNDRETYQFLSRGNTAGVFQLESSGMTDVVTRMLANVDKLPDSELMQCFENLIAAVALYRPGPMQYIDDYIAGSRAESIQYDVPEEEEILKPTYSVIVYQEQVMQLVQRLAGYSMGRADVVRKAMGKKKQDVMDAEKEVFLFGNEKAFKDGKDAKYVPGCIKNGIPEEKAREIWAKMENFAKYAFNRSHAACYAYIAYLTAYMSCHWPEEFYCGMLNAFINNDKLRVYLNQADRRNIRILPPDINRSMGIFSVEKGDDGKLNIRYGLKGLMGVGKASDTIVEVRNGHPFQGFQEMYERFAKADTTLNKKVLEALIYAGALNCFGMKKAVMLNGISILESAAKSDKKVCKDQVSLFDAPGMEKYSRIEFPDQKEFTPRTQMEKEKDILGFYLTAHPMDEIYPKIKASHDRQFRFLSDLVDATTSMRDIKACGIIKNVKQRFTKNNDEMYSFTLEDKFASISCVVFSDRLSSIKPLITNGAIVQVTGDFRPDPNWGNQIIISTMISEDMIFTDTNKGKYLLVTINTKAEQEELKKMVKAHPGNLAVKLQAKNRVFAPAWKIDATPGTIDLLKDMFRVEYMQA